ncbi:MAG: hypothetical protein K0R38_7760 [Polyangiaceae bacterium]|nr:hypothetical protein [Polyangiaceae bacterium]
MAKFRRHSALERRREAAPLIPSELLRDGFVACSLGPHGLPLRFLGGGEARVVTDASRVRGGHVR